MLLMICLSLSSCGAFPRLDPYERCALYLGETLETSKCRCHVYDFDIKGGDILGASYDLEVQHCDRGIVLKTNKGGAWENMVNWRDEVMLWVGDKNQEGTADTRSNYGFH